MLCAAGRVAFFRKEDLPPCELAGLAALDQSGSIDEIDAVRTEMHVIKAEMHAAKAEMHAAKAESAQLAAENARLTAENVQLKAAIAQMRRNPMTNV